tara:strand:+ start:442 stop:552 length:111 start_codon:yes stop_codon:yes gene_type:complete
MFTELGEATSQISGCSGKTSGSKISELEEFDPPLHE